MTSTLDNTKQTAAPLVRLTNAGKNYGSIIALGRMGRIHAASLSARCPSAQLACVFGADTDAARQAGRYTVKQENR